MILTINANAAIDMVMFIDRFIPGETMRPTKVVSSVGGKGLDTAVVLRELGAPVKVVSFTAGRNGETLAGLLYDRQIEAEFVWVNGETRIANVIVETDYARHSHITTPGYTVTDEDCQRFVECIGMNAGQAAWAVIGGSLPGGAPANLYQTIIQLLHKLNVKVLVDCFGPPMLEALAACPEIVKMNQDEFSATFETEPAGGADGRIRAVRAVMAQHNIQNFVLTCGKDGIYAFTPQALYHAKAPLIIEVNAAGSGDAVSGTIPYRLSMGESWQQALTWAAAAGAAVVLTEGTAECSLDDVLRIYPKTTVQVIEETDLAAAM